MCEFFPYIVNWQKSQDNDGSYEPVFLIAPTEEYIPKAFTAFEKRWKINEILNQDHTSLLDSYDK